MARLAAPLFILAAALAACSSNPPPPASPTIVGNEMPYRDGSGVVRSVAPAPASGVMRLEIRMDDGRTQYVDVDSRDFAKGTRVQLSDNRYIIKQ